MQFLSPRYPVAATGALVFLLFTFNLFPLGVPAAPPSPAGTPLQARGNQFIGFTKFSTFERCAGHSRFETVLTSPVIIAQIPWDELVVSWNADLPEDTYLKVEARAFYAAGPTPFYTMGLWSKQPDLFPRQSVSGQADEFAGVDTDTLCLKRRSDRVQVRLTLGTRSRLALKMRFLGLTLTDSKSAPAGGNPAELVRMLCAAPTPNPAAWGRLLPVPEKSQMRYPGGNVLCSPTTLSMMLGFWAHRLARPDLDRDVPEISNAIYDSQWKGTGNWSFNTAYAGSFPGMRAYVSRLSDISELEDWIASGIPVGLSLCYDRLRGKAPKARGNGHLVVCVGFTEQGDVIINDPGTSQNVRKVFPRANVAWAWAHSRNAAYLIYPESAEIPKDRFGHWASWTARQRVRFE